MEDQEDGVVTIRGDRPIRHIMEPLVMHQVAEGEEMAAPAREMLAMVTRGADRGHMFRRRIQADN